MRERRDGFSPESVPNPSRREALRDLVVISGYGLSRFATRGVLGYFLTDKVLQSAEQLVTPRLHSDIEFLKGEEERLQDADSFCLVFGGATVESAKGLAKALPALKEIGPLGYVNYSDYDFGLENIAQKISDLQDNYPNLKRFSVYGHSLGTHVAGAVFAKLIEKGRMPDFEFLFMDSTPPDLSYTNFSKADKLITLLNSIGGSASMTAVINLSVYQNFFQQDSALPALEARQGAILQEGEHSGENLLRIAASVATKKQAHVLFLRVEDERKDPVVDATRSEARLTQLFPGLSVALLEGNEGHGNSGKNGQAYNTAISGFIKRVRG